MFVPKSRFSLEGKISWRTHEARQVGKLKFQLQEVKSWAIISAALYKPFRVICILDGEARLVFESDDMTSAQNYLQNVQPTLQHGDAVSVVTAMFPGARHWALYDAEQKCFWEYQNNEHSTFKSKAQVVGTPEAEFYKRVDGKGMRIEDVPQTSSSPPAEAVKRARSKQGTGYYNAVFNNCESFVRWCVTGEAHSEQVWQFIEPVTQSPATMLLSIPFNIVKHAYASKCYG